MKALIIDDHFSIIGTANFDQRSFFLNEEVNVEIDDKAFTKEVYATIEEDIKRSEPLTKENFKNAHSGSARRNGLAEQYLIFIKESSYDFQIRVRFKRDEPLGCVSR